MKNKFLKIVEENIHRDGIGDLMKWLADSDWYTAPSSTKYHNCFDSGLLLHSMNVYQQLKGVLDRNGISEYSDETIAIVSLFHDLTKVNFYVKGFRNVKNEDTGKWEKKEIYQIEDQMPLGHGEKSVIILQQFMKLTTDEIYAIRWHMGGFDSAVKGGDYGLNGAYEKCNLAVALHIADMEASYFIETKEKPSEEPEQSNLDKAIHDLMDILSDLIRKKGVDKESIYDIISEENEGRKNPNSIQDISVVCKITERVKGLLHE